jgi:hypothetical protein
VQDNTHYVYVIAKNGPDGLTGPVKIGISSKPNKRLSSIQTACPFQVEVACVFAAPSQAIARDIERMFHETQRDTHAHGEWFNVEPVVAIHLLCLGIRVALNEFVSDKSVISDALDLCGVRSAERRFNLAVPAAADDPTQSLQ